LGETAKGTLSRQDSGCFRPTVDTKIFIYQCFATGNAKEKSFRRVVVDEQMQGPEWEVSTHVRTTEKERSQVQNLKSLGTAAYIVLEVVQESIPIINNN
jgi:hypothetical protein